MKPLLLWWRRTPVGTLGLVQGERMEFRYTAEWLALSASFPVSLSLPLQAGPHGDVAHHFFANLLPEADVRSRLCQRLKITPGNDFELLRAIGGECAGALTIGETPPTDNASAADYRTITPTQLRRWSLANDPGAFSSTVGSDGVRLSLAGAQDKLPVRFEQDVVSLPLGQAPSTHLLKFASPHFKYLPENEYLMGLVARRLGLAVPATRLWRIDGGGTILVVERYDRQRSGAAIVRLHQEDFCQALGRSPLAKYQKEGGPRPGELADIVRRFGAVPTVDLPLVARWGLFNWLFGNCDGHAKNISLLFDPTAGVRLAPFYDLVCTRIYGSLDRHLAMSLGEQFDPGHVLRRDLAAYANELGIGPRLVDAIVEEFIGEGPRRFDEAVTEFVEQHGDSPLVESMRLQVAKQLRRARRALD